MSGINPISTAPKDGTRILVFVPIKKDDDVDDEWTLCVCGWFTAWWEERNDFYTGEPTGDWHTGIKEAMDECGELDDPTHWMPLPEWPVAP